MAANTELHMIVPGICGPLAELQPLKNDPVIKRWIKVLARSDYSPSSTTLDDVITSLFGLSITGDFPTAALSLLALDMYEDELHYMCADPVHLQADMDHAILTSSVDLNISENESAVLCDVLNQHFDQDNLNFIRAGKDNWFVSSREKIYLNTTPLAEAVGRNVNFILPKGASSVFWKQVLTEAQMLMHVNEINDKRECAGLQTINSLWFYGSGELPDAKNCRVRTVCSNGNVFKGLARQLQCQYIRLPASVYEYTNYLTETDDNAVNVFHLSELEHLPNYTDVSLWQEKAAQVLEQWIYPLVEMANKNNINVYLYPCNGKQYQFSRYDTLKFWRQEKLEEHVSSY